MSVMWLQPYAGFLVCENNDAYLSDLFTRYSNGHGSTRKIQKNKLHYRNIPVFFRGKFLKSKRHSNMSIKCLLAH